MKKQVFILVALVFVMVLFSACGKEPEQPNDYSQTYRERPENVMEYKDTSKMAVFDEVKNWQANGYRHYVGLNPIHQNAWMPLNAEEFEEVTAMLNQSSWTATESSFPIDLRDETAISVDEIYLFPDDTAALIGSSECFKMPGGTYEKLSSYLTTLFETERGKIMDTENFCKGFFAEDFWLKWQMFYNPPHYVGDDNIDEYIYQDLFACYGSAAMAEELMTALGDFGLWQSLSLKENTYLFQNSGTGISLNNKDISCEIFPGANQSTYILFGSYAAFYTTENVYKSVMDVIKSHDDQWQFIDQSGY